MTAVKKILMQKMKKKVETETAIKSGGYNDHFLMMAGCKENYSGINCKGFDGLAIETESGIKLEAAEFHWMADAAYNQSK